MLGTTSTTFLGLPDNRLDTLLMLEVIQSIERIIERIKPQIIYSHHYGDLNIDHRISHQALMTVCRPVPASSLKEIYAFEVMSSTEWGSVSLIPFTPTLHVDISNYIYIKLQALEAYAMEMRPLPHARSIKHLTALAHHRGALYWFASCRGICGDEDCPVMEFEFAPPPQLSDCRLIAIP